MKPSRTRQAARLLALGLAGGCVFQAVGCISGITPVVLSFFESATLSYLLSALVP